MPRRGATSEDLTVPLLADTNRFKKQRCAHARPARSGTKSARKAKYQVPKFPNENDRKGLIVSGFSANIIKFFSPACDAFTSSAFTLNAPSSDPNQLTATRRQPQRIALAT